MYELPHGKRGKWTASKAGKHMNELQTKNDVIGNSGRMKLVTILKRDTSLNVVVQKFGSVAICSCEDSFVHS